MIFTEVKTEALIKLLKVINKEEDSYWMLFDSILSELENRGISHIMQYKCKLHHVQFDVSGDYDCGCPVGELELVVNELCEDDPDTEPKEDF